MSKFLILIFSFSFIFFSEQVYPATRGDADLLNEKAYCLQFQISQFYSTSSFSENGVEVPFSGDQGFSVIDSDFKLSYGIEKNLESTLFFKARNVKVNDGTTAASNTGPESVGISAKYQFGPIGNIKYALGVHYLKTLYTNTVYANENLVPKNSVILGDDGTEYGVGFFSTYLNHPWKLNGALVYVSPPNDLSSEISYKAEILYQLKTFSFFAGIDGIYSLQRDQAIVKPFMASGMPSKYFNSFNREKFSSFLGLDYLIGKVDLNFKVSMVLAGKSTDKGSLIQLGFSWGTEGVSPESVKVSSFKEYHIEGSVLKVSARGNFVKIDQGLSTDVEKGMSFDIYQTDYFGGNLLVASGVIHEVGSDWSVIKVVKKYSEIDIKPGFAARGY